jgi:hypothetical protein
LARDIEIVKSLETKNKGVTFNLERYGEDYIIFQNSYDERLDYIFSSNDEVFMTKVLSFMVDSYNDGLRDGKNIAMMFGNSGN